MFQSEFNLLTEGIQVAIDEYDVHVPMSKDIWCFTIDLEVRDEDGNPKKDVESRALVVGRFIGMESDLRAMGRAESIACLKSICLEGIKNCRVTGRIRRNDDMYSYYIYSF